MLLVSVKTTPNFEFFKKDILSIISFYLPKKQLFYLFFIKETQDEVTTTEDEIAANTNQCKFKKSDDTLCLNSTLKKYVLRSL